MKTSPNFRAALCIAATSPRLSSVLLLLVPAVADASFLHGEALDSLANGIAWAVLVIAPIVAIAIFWLVHILPEKIAEKKHHPQAKAIQTLCLLSLVFGGMLWPIAWIWAYTRPVLHKMAYGTDVVKHEHDENRETKDTVIAALPDRPQTTSTSALVTDDAQALRRRLAELEAKLKATAKPEKV